MEHIRALKDIEMLLSEAGYYNRDGEGGMARQTSTSSSVYIRARHFVQPE